MTFQLKRAGIFVLLIISSFRQCFFNVFCPIKDSSIVSQYWEITPKPFYFSSYFLHRSLSPEIELQLTPAGSLISINENTDLPRRKQEWTPSYFRISSADVRGWPWCSLLKAQPLSKRLLHQSQGNHRREAIEMSFLIVLPVATRGTTARLVGPAGS